MEKAANIKKITGLLNLDPRTKLMILVLFSVVVIIYPGFSSRADKAYTRTENKPLCRRIPADKKNGAF